MKQQVQLLTCPRCGAEQLELEPSGVACGGCGDRYPRVGGIPCLFENPDAHAQWSARLAAFARDNEGTRDRVLAQLAGTRLHRLTRARLQTLHERLQVHAERLLALMQESGIEPRSSTAPASDGVPGEGTLTSYYHHVHRDWGWDDHSTEVGDAIAALRGVVPSTWQPGAMLVLGAGACRLPYEVHRRWGARTTVALDINPLPFLVAKKLIEGATVPLFEFPISPWTSQQVVVDRNLRCADADPTGFSLVFADALDPPVKAGAFDTVFTPWFIDQVPKDLSTLLGCIHRALRDGGTWLNFGPLLYHPSHTMLAHRYRVDEVLALAEEAGFTIEVHTHQRMLYMQSPAGSQGRTEGILTFRAIKSTSRVVAEPEPQPAWQSDARASVPAWPGLASYTAPHPMFAAVVALIDGTRSIRDIADVLVRNHGLPPDAAEGGVLTCLLEIQRTLIDEP